MGFRSEVYGEQHWRAAYRWLTVIASKVLKRSNSPGTCLFLIALFTGSLTALAGPLNTIPIPIDDDITIFVPVTPNTGNPVPGFGVDYIQNYQYAPKITLTFPDGRSHQIPSMT